MGALEWTGPSATMNRQATGGQELAAATTRRLRGLGVASPHMSAHAAREFVMALADAALVSSMGHGQVSGVANFL